MKKQVITKSHLGNIVYGTGIVGAAICMLYAVDCVWIQERGRSLLQISDRFVAHENASHGILIGIVLGTLYWGIGTYMRSFVNKSAALRVATKQTL